MRQWSSPRAVIVAYVLAVGVLHYDTPRFRSPNERSRLYALEAIFTAGTLAIDGPLARHGDIEDKVVFNGRAYSNKPPGLLLLALPGYALAALVDSAAPGIGTGLYGARVGAVSLPVIAFLWLLAAELRRRLVPPAEAALWIAAVAFGSGLLPYGAMLMSHATTAALLGAAGLLILRSPATDRGCLAVGMLCGLAVACEYPAALPAAILGVWAVVRASWRHRLLLAVGAAPAAVLILGYNAVVFGSPLDLGYGHHVQPQFAAIHGAGGIGFGLPGWDALVGLLLAPSKGLLAWSPWLLVALVLGLRAVRWHGDAASWPLLLAAAALVLFIAGYPNWHGGWTVGPRYLLPVVPLVAIAAVTSHHRVGSRWRMGVFGGLVAASIVNHGLPALSWPYLPELVANPLFDLSLPLLAAGVLAPTVLPIGGLAGVGLVIVGLAVVLGLVVALRPAPGLASAVAALVLVGLASIHRGQGPIRFCRGEILYLTGHDRAARTQFEELLANEGPSPAMAGHVTMRLQSIAGTEPPEPTAGDAGVN